MTQSLKLYRACENEKPGCSRRRIQTGLIIALARRLLQPPEPALRGDDDTAGELMTLNRLHLLSWVAGVGQAASSPK